MLNETIVEKFKAGLRGELIQRSDERYDEARKLYNAMINKRPLLIARCADVADVISAVRFGRTSASDRYPGRRSQRAPARKLQRRARD